MSTCIPNTLVVSPSEKPACVYEKTLERMQDRGWSKITQTVETVSEKQTATHEISTKKITLRSDDPNRVNDVDREDNALETTGAPLGFPYPIRQ